ncbi:hypothetical protein C8Q74DRAFT_1305899 [Fomes fomentarius]|nr:hypothetical protein C8Q74DRAFT_1305899 [Fomes fomentarius]
MTSGDGDDLRIRRRLVIPDAKSVNDLLKIIYDVLEVHRLVAKRRDVLHRDMSIYNILMYPKWGKFTNHKFIKDLPPLIDDILGGQLRNSDEYQALCLLTDFDNSAMLDDTSQPNELALRTGTPMYIARSVAAGRLWVTPTSFKYSKPMPELIPAARELYDKLHGPERYKLYEDVPGVTIHGGIPPPPTMDTTDLELPPGFRHKLEYDAESTFWTTAAALLQVQPAKGMDTSITCGNLKAMWAEFERHTIGERGVDQTDSREAAFLGRMLPGYANAFLPCMQDVAALLFHMAQQVRPSYGLMSTPPPHDDHLHEALQRLILNYLVEHRDNDIELTPGVTRSTNGIPGSRGTKRTREIVAEELRGAKRPMRSKDSSMPPQAENGFPPCYA